MKEKPAEKQPATTGKLEALPELKKLPVPDTVLVDRVKQGSAEAFEELVRRYEHKVYSITYRMMGNPEDARDAQQEAFLRAYRFLPKFEAKSSFYTWLYRIATNVSLTKLRRRKEPRTVSLDEPLGEDGSGSLEIPDDVHTPETEFKRRRLRDAIQKAVDELPPDYKPVVVLRDMEGLPNEEVSESLGISVPAVKSRLHRGRMMLRERLAKYMAEYD
jgi:RNA polymerase sigma-70 factor (ECF subfamily)